MPVAAQINGRLYAIDADHLNTPRRLTNTQGQVAWQWLISGFGEVQPTTGANGYALNGIPSSKVYSEPVTFKLRYPGQVWDEETGLADNLHRYYDAQVGRYVQADPIGLEGGGIGLDMWAGIRLVTQIRWGWQPDRLHPILDFQIRGGRRFAAETIA